MDDFPEKQPSTEGLKPVANGRDADGRFTAGNCGGGRRPEPQSIDEAVQKAMTPQRIKAIVAQAICDAEAGDRFARKWLTEIVKGFPRPVPADVFQSILAELNANAEASESA